MELVVVKIASNSNLLKNVNDSSRLLLSGPLPK